MATPNYGQVTVTGTATQIVGATGRRTVTIKNTDAANKIRLGDSAVAASTGHELAAGENITLSASGGVAIYGIAVTSSCVVTFLEEV